MTLDTYTPATLASLAKGEYFTTSNTSNVVYVKGEYCRTRGRWICRKATDINVGRALKKSAIVYTGFTY